MLVWGGASQPTGSFQNGATYDLVSDTWKPLPETDAASWIGSAVWTGSEMIVLGAGLAPGSDAVLADFGVLAGRYRRLALLRLGLGEQPCRWTSASGLRRSLPVRSPQ